MKESRVPERMCAVCRNKAQKNNFIRLVKNKDGMICVDKSYKMNGRGMYICSNSDCISKAVKTKAINRSFKTNVDSQVYEELVNAYEHKQD